LIHRRRFPVDHFVLVVDNGSVDPEVMMLIAHRRASDLALRTTGDRGNFTLIHNGSALARRPDAHVHIVCAGSRAQKAMMYLLIGLKNLLS
jgi:hypothetical protein